MKKFIFLLILPLFLGSVFFGCCHMKKTAPAPVEVVAPPPPPPPPAPEPEPAPAPAPEPMQEKG
jgi:hypothetical protein